MSYFHLWALSMNGDAGYVAPGTFDGYTLVTTVVVAGPGSVSTGGAGDSSYGTNPWTVLASVYNPLASHHGRSDLDPVVVFTSETGAILRQVSR
jgi:hypothetical protein